MPDETMNKTDTNKKKVLKALEISKGIVSTACQNSGVCRTQFYVWIQDDKQFKDAVDEIREASIDFVESKLLEKIEGIEVQTGIKDGQPIVYSLPPSDTAIIFYLKCKAKKRGYIERQEIDLGNTGGEPFKVTLNL